MNVKDFTYLLQYPDKVNALKHTKQLEDIVNDYPYFQAARALHLKGLKNGNSFKYNNALKTTAAYTADREVLFDFITSKEFIQDNIANSISGKTDTVKEIAETPEIIKPTEEFIEASEDKPLPQSVKDADQILDPELFKSKNPEIDKSIAAEKKKAAETLELGKPLPFTKMEKHSFGEWLQLATLKTVNRDPEENIESVSENKKETPLQQTEETSKKKKFDLIDKFLDDNPKIVPKENKAAKIDISSSIKLDKNELMTETLAKVYLEQKKYKKAIQAYKILSLKYPEKSGFFADRINAVEKIQKENTEE